MDRINGFQIEFYYDTWIDPLLVIPIQTAEMVYRFDFPLINTYYDFVNDDSITQIKNVSSPYIVDTKLWNVSNVTTMESMFQDALVFNQPIDVWNTYNVEIWHLSSKMRQSFNKTSVYGMYLWSPRWSLCFKTHWYSINLLVNGLRPK